MSELDELRRRIAALERKEQSWHWTTITALLFLTYLVWSAFFDLGDHLIPAARITAGAMRAIEREMPATRADLWVRPAPESQPKESP